MKAIDPNLGRQAAQEKTTEDVGNGEGEIFSTADTTEGVGALVD